MKKKPWCATEFAAAGAAGATTASAGFAGAGAAEAYKVSGPSGTSDGASRSAGGTSSLGCIGETLMRLPQRARTVLPQKVMTYSPFLISRGFWAHLMLSPLRKVLKAVMSSGSGNIEALRSAQSP